MIFAKMANLRKRGIGQESIKGLAKYSNEITKRGILTNGDFTKMTNFEKIYLRFGKNWNKMTKEACR